MRHGGYRSSDLMYQGKHHGDVFFRGRFMEKMYIENDYCDGLIWEKMHNDDAILCITSWYPGDYSANNWQGTRLIPQDPRMPCVPPGGLGYGYGDVLMRTKDFIISKVGTYYYMDTGSYSITRDGKKWTKRIRGVPANWLASTFGWSIDENVGILPADGKIYRFEIEDDGKLTWRAIANDLGSSNVSIGSIASQGIVQDGEHRRYRFINSNGNLYTSRLPDRYTYTSFERDGTVKTMEGTYSWTFYYLHGKYIAFTKDKINSRHWNGSSYEIWYDAMYVESDDGFSTIRWRYFDSPRLAYAYQWVKLLYFEEKFLMYERGETVSGSGTHSPYFWIWDFGNSFFNSPKKIVVPQSYTVPMVGIDSDQNVDSVTVVMYGSVPAQNRNYTRSINDFNKSTVYIKDGKPTEPYGGIMIPTAFSPRGSSGAYNEGGWIYLDGGLLKAPERGIAYGGKNYMIERDNATWGTDYFKLTIKGADNENIKITEENSTYKPYSYSITKGDSDYIKYFKFNFRKTINAKCGNVTLRRSLRREGKTILDFRDLAYNEASEYFFDEVGEFTNIHGRSYTKINPGKAYCFSVRYYYSNGHRGQTPLVVSMDEFTSIFTAVGSGTDNNVRTIEYGGILWYYTGFSYGFYDWSEPDSPRYIDLFGMGNVSEQERVKECIRIAHGI